MTAATVAEPDVIEVRPGGDGAIEAMTRGEIDIQVATAKRFPRSLKAFKERALEMATLDEETAESCIYALPRDGKTIEGPSARLAEILASAYGHMRVEGRTVGDDGKFVTARGTAWDIQSNVLIAFEVKRRVTGRNGKRFSDDMITVTSNAATSIAIRNAVLKVVPKAFWGPVYDACRKVAVGDASTLVKKRAAMVDHFMKMGVLPERIYRLMDVKGIEDITLEHLATLKGIATAIKDAETTVDEAFQLPTREVKESATPAPDGFDAWLLVLRDAAKGGEARLSEAWLAAPEPYRIHLTTTDPDLWLSLKNTATDVSVSAKRRS